ncbi:MAG TPA: FISUMP domain-containing protein, partial [Bacteroidales bacterium]|nr:FISUMP domain-containing protein [Bacteroidales bacterium]
MKSKIFFLLLLIAFCQADILAQDYQISFAGSGAATTVTSVKVENLTQGTNLEMDGTNILHLVNSITGINEVTSNEDRKITFSPNPMNEFTKMQFFLPEEGMVYISIYDVTGKYLFQAEDYLYKGLQIYNIRGVANGLNVVTVKSKDYSISGRFLGDDRETGRVRIEYENTIATQSKDNTTETKGLDYYVKGINEEVLMQYNTGDRLKFTATSGNYMTVLTGIPTESRLLTFNFISCTDDDGKNYPVVTLGSQIWMAENLAYLPAVSPSSIGSDTEKHYYVYDYQGTNVNEAKATVNYLTYGVLYNWPAAMNGQAGSSTNPSGVRGVC